MTTTPRLRSWLHAALPAGLAVLCQACTPPAPRAGVVAGHIIVQEGFADPIYAVDATTGKTVATMPPEGWANASIGTNGLVYFHGRGGLVARDVQTGDVRWRVMLMIGRTRPVVASKGLVFVPQWESDSTAWVGFDAANGKRSFELHSDEHAPLAANDDVLVTFENHDLVGFNASDGKERWRSSLKVEGPIMIESGRLFARVDDDQLGVFTASSGALQRRMSLGGTDAFSASAIRPQLAASGNLVAWIQDEVLHVADASSGKESWRHEHAELLAITPDALVTSWNDELLGLDPATGSSKWKLRLDGDPLSVTAQQDTIAVRTDATRYSVVDARSGKRRFVYDLPSL